MGKPRKETLRHQAAFEFYYALGAERTLSAVARQCHVSETGARQWSQGFEWQKRVVERDAILKKMMAEKAIDDAAESAALQLKICRAVQARFAQGLSAGSVGVSAQDFVKVSQHELLLRGKATERSEVQFSGPDLDRFVDAVAAIIAREVADPEVRARISAALVEAAQAEPGDDA